MADQKGRLILCGENAKICQKMADQKGRLILSGENAKICLKMADQKASNFICWKCQNLPKDGGPEGAAKFYAVKTPKFA